MKIIRFLIKITLWLFAGLIACIIVIILIFPTPFWRLSAAIGSQMAWFGYNEKGNSVALYSLAKIEEKESYDYHAFSVQNSKNGNYSLAISALDSAYALDKDEGAYYGWLLLYYYHDYERALKLLEEFDKTTPNFSDAPVGENIHYLKGLAHMQLGRKEKAIELFNKYIHETDSAHGEGWVNIYAFIEKGRCLADIEEHRQAIEAYNKALKEYSKSPEAHYYKGLSYVALTKKDSAELSFLKAEELILKGYKSSENYIEAFHEIYIQDVKQQLNLLAQ